MLYFNRGGFMIRLFSYLVSILVHRSLNLQKWNSFCSVLHFNDCFSSLWSCGCPSQIELDSFPSPPYLMTIPV